MQTSDKIDLVAAAVVKAQSELKHAVKESSSEAFKRNGKAMKYADLTAVWDAAKPVLTANKLAALQDVVCNDQGIGVRTRLMHESGQWIEFDPPMIPLEKRNAHGVGSACTYGRRFSLSAALGVVADEDDDGNAASASNGNGVADAHRITEVDKIKNPPGRSAVVTKVREYCRELQACSDATELSAVMNTDEFKKFAFKVCCEYPNDWLGEEANSGLSGNIAQLGERLKCQDDTDSYIHRMERARDEKLKPKQAAE